MYFRVLYANFEAKVEGMIYLKGKLGYIQRGMCGLLVVTFGLQAHLAQGQNEQNTERLDRYLTHLDTQNQAMGMLSLWRGGQEVYHRTWGWAHQKDSLPLSRTTPIRVGSISKTFTAVVIHRLIEKGKLSLQDTLRWWFPQIPQADSITLKNLLAQTSGLGNYTDAPDYQQYHDQALSPDSLLEKISQLDPLHKPGERFSYSNSNYTLLTLIAEQVSGQSMEKLIRRYITEPLGLKHTGYGSLTKGPGEAVAPSYLPAGEGWRRADTTHWSVLQGAGAVYSTSDELCRFYYSLLQGALIPLSRVEQILPGDREYGHGLLPVPFYARRGVGHSGGVDGYRSMALHFPDQDITLALVLSAARPSTNDILIGILSTYWGYDYEFPSYESTQLPETWLEKLSGTYTSANFPLDLKLSQREGTLYGQATGQPEFPLVSRDSTHFYYNQAGLKLEYFPREEALLLKQAGREYRLQRQ